jgi:hypothetical protein
MSSPAKSPTSASRKPDDAEELAKWHCVLNLFGEATGADAFFARNIKEAIDACLAEEEGLDASLANFTEAALRLAAENDVLSSSYGLFHLDLRGRDFDPLFVRGELLGGLKRIAGYETALVLVTGLRGAVTGTGKRFTAQRQAAYVEAKAYIDSVTAEWTTENTAVSILYT